MAGGGVRTPGARVLALSAALAVVVVAVQAAMWHLIGAPSPRGAGPLLLGSLVLLFALAERFTVKFPVRRGAHTMTLSEIPLVLGLLMIHPALLVLVRLAGALAGLILLRGQRGSKLVFNTILYLTQATMAGVVFHLLGGPADPYGPVGWAAAFASTFVADLVSIVLISAVIAVHDDSQEWRRLMSADVKELLQMPLVAVSTTLALVTALLVRQQIWAGLLLGVLVFAAYRVFDRYAQQTRTHQQVEDLYRFTRSLDGLTDAREVARTILDQARDVVRAEETALIVPQDGRLLRMRMHGRDRFDVTPVNGSGDPGSDQHSGQVVDDRIMRGPVEGPTAAEPGIDRDAASEVPLDHPRAVVNRDAPEDSGIVDDDWWRPARTGTPVLRPQSIAVPVRLGELSGVLYVSGCLPDTPAFTDDNLRLLQAMASHAGSALSEARLLERLRHTAAHDPLTGLPNRQRYLADLQEATDAAAVDGRTVGVLLLDLDRFKDVNDGLGHDTGDDLLRQIGRRLEDRYGAHGTVSRFGGDEFALIIRDGGSQEAILALAEDVRRTVELPAPVGDLELDVQVSIGVCVAPEHGADADRLLRRADLAMYAAKDSRCGVRVYRAEDDHDTARRLALMAGLRVAVDAGTLTVVYQPKVDPASGRVLGAEALVRWQHEGRPVPPDEFIPLAERARLIGPLTAHVLDTALADCATWRGLGHPLSVAVNLSPDMLTDPALTGQIEQALSRHGLPAAALTLEITENAIMADPTNARRTLDALHGLGVKLSIDDFGTGHSSLGRLAHLPIHEMKIDKSFVRHIVTDHTRRAVTDAALQLARALDLTVVAEGVEEQDELDYLRRHGCHAIQGYLISKPIPPVEFLTWLTTHRAAGQLAV
ncbi:GGDEF domain-containing protein [Actinoplanes philippinensis]|uniref:GGDEF domain-containing protein n=1 Tax=Actinoplanes philippinensis TaxID=35752 RepID=UPI0033CC7905